MTTADFSGKGHSGLLIAGDSVDSWGTNPSGSGSDSDGDEILDGFDNCPDDFNPGQEDSDLDQIGDVCDPFPDDPNNDLARALVDLAAAEAELADTHVLLNQCLAAAPSCTDGMDNDGDGHTDYPDDPDCESQFDNSECGLGVELTLVLAPLMWLYRRRSRSREMRHHLEAAREPLEEQ